MSQDDTSAIPPGWMSDQFAAGSVPFRSATVEDAYAVAIAMFDRGERVDMQALSARLGVGRTTLYRWVGDREKLLGTVLAAMSERTFALAMSGARGSGVPRALGTIRTFMRWTSTYQPLCDFAVREPALALNVLMSHDGAVAEALRTGFRASLQEAGVELPGEIGREVLDILVQLATAMEWSPIVIGQPAAIDHAIRLMAVLLEPR